MTRFVVLFLISCVCCVSHAQTVMLWNVENLFDCRHDSLKQDYDFLPEGSYHWTPGRYWQKVRDVSRVILDAGGERPLDIVGLCEVENDSVMRDLTQRSPLRSIGYRYVMTDSPDRRGVDVALLYNPQRFVLLGHQSLRLPSQQHGLPPTRDLLHCWGRMAEGTDTLHLVVCHLPSKTGGRAGARNRALAADVLAALADSIAAVGQPLLVMGDFNAAPGDPVFRKLSGLQDLVPQDRRPREGTYRYQGRWQWIDHFLVSAECRVQSSELGVRLYTAPW